MHLLFRYALSAMARCVLTMDRAQRVVASRRARQFKKNILDFAFGSIKGCGREQRSGGGGELAEGVWWSGGIGVQLFWPIRSRVLPGNPHSLFRSLFLSQLSFSQSK